MVKYVLSTILAPVADAKNTGARYEITLGRQAPTNLAASARFLDATGFVASRSCIGAAGPPLDRPPENRRSHLPKLGNLCRIPRRGMRRRSATTGPERRLPM